MATISKYQTGGGATLYRVRYRTPDNRQTDKRGLTTNRDAERWANKVEVDFLRRRVELHRNVVDVNGMMAVGSLKNNRNRTVVLPGFVVDALAQTAEGKEPRRVVVAVRDRRLSRAAVVARFVAGRCSAALQETDKTFPRVTAHALRHTAASLAISAGANPKVVQRMLGHASAAMTLDVYADVFDSDLSSVAESVGKMWAREA